MDSAKLIIDCLRYAVLGKEIDRKSIESLNESELKALFKKAKHHDVANVVASVVCEEPLDKSLENVAKIFENEQMNAIFRCENIVYEIERISEIFSENAIDHVLLKGAVIRDLYPEPWMRTSCDIDVLIREESIEAAIKLLTEGLDFSYDGNRNYHDVSLYSPGGVHLELHFSIMENIEILDRVLSKVWEHASAEEGSLYRLSSEFFLYHVIAHTAYHFIRGGCGIRSILDLWLIKNNFSYDENELLKLCRESELEEFYKNALALADCWFSDGEHNEITANMAKFILDGGAYGDSEAGVAALRESHGGRIGYARSRIWLSYYHLRQKYPSLKNRALIPVYQVRRWIDVVRLGKLSKSAKELKNNNDIDSEKSSAVAALMYSVGLKNHLQ